MPEWLAIVILGIVEGVTEFLPISSTGHLLLVQHWLPRQSDLFNTVIQSGAVIAVGAVFWERLRQFAFRWRDPDVRDYLLKLFVAFFLTSVGGLIMKKLDFELPETVAPVAWATLIGGILLLAAEAWLRGRKQGQAITWTMVVAFASAQLLAAIFPGTSRSGATILAGLALGLSRPAAAEFSFLLGIPTLMAAGALQTVSALRDGSGAEVPWSYLLLGTIVSAVTAFAVVKWLLRFVQNHTFVGFAWYRIVLGLVLLWSL